MFDDYLYEMMDIADLFSLNMGHPDEGYQTSKGGYLEAEIGGRQFPGDIEV